MPKRARPIDTGSHAETLPNVFTVNHLLGFLAYVAGCLRVSVVYIVRYLYKVLTLQQQQRQQHY